MADKDGKLVLDLVDVYRKPLKEKVDVLLKHQVLSDSKIARSVNASPKPRISNLFGEPEGLYRIEIDPPSYLPVSQFIRIQSSGDTEVTIPFPIDPKKVKKVLFPKYPELPEKLQQLLEASDGVLGFEGKKGPSLYAELDDIRKAGLLNISAKSVATPLLNGATVFPSIQQIIELRGDRFFARVPKQLREETKNSISEGLFDKVDGSLHHLADPAFSDAGSFKTPDHYGNLQLTFFMNPAGDCVADIDIDDAAGLGHVFQVLRNSLTGRPTHPYDIHEILVFHQRIDPGYTFAV
jgi:hypothetical protein